MSHSIAKFPWRAPSAAAGMFSMMPRAASCRPRWATGRAVSQSGARIFSGDLEHAFDLDRRIGGQRGDADSRPGMPALVAERCDHQVGGAGQHLRPVEIIRCRIDEAADPHHADHLVEVAECRLYLRQQIDRAGLRCGVALFGGDAGAELALGNQLAVGIGANLAGDEQQVSGTHEADIVRHGGAGFWQDHALCRQLLFDRARHVSSPFELTKSLNVLRPALFRASRTRLQAWADRRRGREPAANSAKSLRTTTESGVKFPGFRDAALVATQ